MITFTKEQLIASAHARIEFAEMMLADELEPLKERTWSIELELARIAMASLEAEPVAYIFKHPDGRLFWTLTDESNKGQSDVMPVYSAPPAPVSVHDEHYQHLSELYHAQEKRLFKLAQRINGPSFDKYAHSPSQAIDVLESALFGESADACRTAMLQGSEPVMTAYKLRDAVEVIRNSGIAFDAEKIQADRDALNSPVIPDGWVMVPVEPTYQMCEAMSLPWESPRFPDRYKAMLASAPHFREISNSSTNNFRENAETSTKCWCHTCRPVTISDMRFVVCPDCGNKRCPHANDHRNACTGSNEPGQEGSAYPAAPQQEVK